MESIYKSDVVVVGSGISGLMVAISLFPRKVTLVTKKKLGEVSSSAWAQGGIAAAVGDDDHPDIHFADTIKASSGLNNDEAVKLITSEALKIVQFLEKINIQFDRDEEKNFCLSIEAAHSRRRVLKINGDQSGKFIKSKSNLKKVRSEVWMDIIFVNINSNEIDFKEYVKPLEERWSKFIKKEDQELIVHSKDYGYFNLEVNCNWKFAIENYCESYHLPTIHPELNRVSNINDHYHIQGLPNRFAGQGSKNYQQLIKGNKKFNTFPNWDKNLLKNSEYIALFPNVMIGLHIDHFYIFWLEPLSINKTREHMQMYYVGDESANGKELYELRKENARFWKDVMLEDINAIEGMQEGRNSPVYNGGNFSPTMDQPTHQFHKWVANSLL